MAGQPPDPRTLNSWEDAFQHSLPVVRKLEQQLRKNIDENRQKLRSLVGASYRDLLGTAERIIEMDEQMQTVESYLGDIGKKCNARTIEKISDNHVRIQRMKEARDGDRYRSMAQIKVLQNCLTAASRIVKARGDALQASKLFVLSRLLHKSLSDESEPPAVLEELRRKLNTLRARLLLYIEHGLSRINADKINLTSVLCAYALVTSSSPKEVLRHFLQIRYDQLEGKSESPSEGEMLKMLDLYSQTLLDTRELFPRRFADVLSQLSKVPLLEDDQIKSIAELNVDIYKSWIAEDIRTFTPWIRHDQLVSSDATDALVAWAKQAQASLLDGLQSHLQNQSDAHEILESRHKFISKFIGLSSRIRMATPANAIQDLRMAFFARLEQLAVQSVSLDHLALDEAELSSFAKAGSNNSSIWDIASNDFDLARGAFGLRQAILDKQHGRDDSIRKQVESLDEWMKQVLKFIDIANAMGSHKWDDDLDFDLDDLDDGDSLQQMLSKQDPENLRNKLRDASQSAILQVTEKIMSAARSTEHSMFYLRTWREIDLRRRALGSRLSIPRTPMSLTQLHQNISHAVSEDVVDSYLRSSKIRGHVALTLWDGTPPLPVQPSPHTFKFLIDLHREMSSTGPDLWTYSCVVELKRIVLERISPQLSIEDLKGPKPHSELTNGHIDPDDANEDDEAVGDADAEKEDEVKKDEHIADVREPYTDDSQKNHLIQMLFDLHYLHRAFDDPSHVEGESGALDGLIGRLTGSCTLDGNFNSRLKKSASEYWKRTYLMFGLLAPDSIASKG